MFKGLLLPHVRKAKKKQQRHLTVQGAGGGYGKMGVGCKKIRSWVVRGEEMFR